MTIRRYNPHCSSNKKLNSTVVNWPRDVFKSRVISASWMAPPPLSIHPTSKHPETHYNLMMVFIELQIWVPKHSRKLSKFFKISFLICHFVRGHRQKMRDFGENLRAPGAQKLSVKYEIRVAWFFIQTNPAVTACTC